MLIIFDVDGTLVGGEAHDWNAFDQALHQHLGFVHTPGWFSRLGDVTAELVLRAAAESCGRECSEAIRERVVATYLEGLRSAHERSPIAFPARNGVNTLLKQLASMPAVSIAIATGDWLPTISFKLQCAGIECSTLPIATSSDAASRADIIRLAATRAGSRLDEAVYVGDGLWDLRTCRRLGIPFIATGARLDQLLHAGAEFSCEDLLVEPFLEVLSVIGERRAAIPPPAEPHESIR